jgi:hypothetical protein
VSFNPKPEEVGKVGAPKNEAILQKMTDRYHYGTIDSLADHGGRYHGGSIRPMFDARARAPVPPAFFKSWPVPLETRL